MLNTPITFKESISLRISSIDSFISFSEATEEIGSKRSLFNNAMLFIVAATVPFLAFLFFQCKDL